MVRGMDADCDTPLGVSCVRGEDELAMVGYAGAADGGEWVRETVVGDPGQPVAVAEALIAALEAGGAREILRRAAESGR